MSAQVHLRASSFWPGPSTKPQHSSPKPIPRADFIALPSTAELQINKHAGRQRMCMPAFQLRHRSFGGRLWSLLDLSWQRWRWLGRLGAGAGGGLAVVHEGQAAALSAANTVVLVFVVRSDIYSAISALTALRPVLLAQHCGGRLRRLFHHLLLFWFWLQLRSGLQKTGYLARKVLSSLAFGGASA